MRHEDVLGVFSLLIVNVLAAKGPPPVALQSGPFVITDQDQTSSIWPSPYVRLGQVAGIDTDRNGNVHVFHRGSRVWGEGSFGPSGEFLQKAQGPIKEATHLVLDKNTGEVISEKGANTFYMPHGLTVDNQDNVWVTDVALHQVMKFKHGQDTPSLVLGKPFKHGSDSKHFCQPTDVAVSERTGEFFVADGYCNSRIMKFSHEGRFLFQWGTHNVGNRYPQPTGHFAIPHSITLTEDWDLICVADRENQRIQCFSAGLDSRGIPTGTFIKKAEDVGRVYAIDQKNHYLVGVTNRGRSGESPRLFIVDMETGRSEVAEPGLGNPHDVAAEADERGNIKTIYVAEIGPNTIRKIEL